MPQLIKNAAVADDAWTVVRDAAAADALPAGPVIVPFGLWRTERAALLARGSVGVWLAPSDDPAAIADDAAQLPVIAVDFPQFTDGRGYSTGRLLRERFGYSGELRAIGDVHRDQLYYLSQCGFDAFALANGHPLDAALASLSDFADGYQLTNRRTPWFRRRGPNHAFVE